MMLEYKDCAIGVEDWSFMNLKKPVLTVRIDNRSYKLASFNNNESAETFQQFLINTNEKGISFALENLREKETNNDK